MSAAVALMPFVHCVVKMTVNNLHLFNLSGYNRYHELERLRFLLNKVSFLS